MLFSILEDGDLQSALISLLLILPMMALALSAHEAAHGWMAYKCGDPTAYLMGRLTLNPLKHLDPLGFLFLLIFGYGWAKPVRIDARNFRNPRRGMALTGAAGPGANLILGLLCAVLGGFFYALYYCRVVTTVSTASITDPGFLTNCMYWLYNMFVNGAMINFLFMVFNLIPVPPFDGSRIAFVFLPNKLYFGIMKYERQIMMGMLIALLVLSRFGISPFGWIASKLTVGILEPVSNLFFKLLLPAFT
ncbi:MAG: site-2 protease family protein [Clostridia bacterium]|nr:site-2 protease family protein [Clostridia bacterium]